MLLKIIGGLLVVWLAFIVLGAVIHAVFYLAIIGAVLALGTGVYGAIKNRSNSTRRIR
jgi:hypothetical protein